MTMTLEYALVDSAGRVDRLLELAGLQQAPAGLSIVHLGQVLPCWPEPPFSGAELRWSAGALAWHDPRPIEAVRAEQWAAIKAHRAELDAQPVEVDGVQLDGDERSRIDILGAVVAMQIKGETSRAWRCSDNAMRLLTLEQIQQAGIAIADRRQALIETSDALFQQIAQAQTSEEVRAIFWPIRTG